MALIYLRLELRNFVGYIRVNILNIRCSLLFIIIIIIIIFVIIINFLSLNVVHVSLFFSGLH